MAASVVVFLSFLLLALLPVFHARPHVASSSHILPAFTPQVAPVSAASPGVSKTVLQWERQLRTCDTAADFDIEPAGGTSRVIYAIGDADPTSDSAVRRHSTMGVKNLNLLASEPTPPMPSDTRSYTFMSRPFPIDKDTLTAPSTYYHCQAFQRNFSDRAHIIRVTPQVDFYHSSLVHHMILYQCGGRSWSESDLAWAGDCYGDSSPAGIGDCDMQHVLGGWAVGGGEFYYPEEVGFPIGPGVTNMMLQIHYHNPHGVTFNDSAGFVITTTPTLRKYDAASLTLSHDLSSLKLAPHINAVNVSVYLPADCTQDFPADGLTVFAGMQHTHETGVALHLQHFRGKEELPLVDGNEHYDFAFQQMVAFSADRYPIFRKGDAFQLTCTYTTKDRSNVTKGGLATTDEMCIEFLWYYPARYTAAPLTVALGHGSLPSNSPVQVSTCVYQNSSYQTYQLPIPPRTPLVSPSCNPAAAGNRTWGSPSALDGTTGTTAITASQWLLDRASYQRSAVLDDAGLFVLYWNVSVDANKANGVIRFAAEVQTTGWVGLGLSPTGAMVDADSVIGWVQTVAEGASSTVVDLTDRWNAEYAQPKVDVSQDVYDVRGVQALLPRTAPPVNPIYYNVSGSAPYNPDAPGCCSGPDSGISMRVVLAAVGLVLLAAALMVAAVWWLRKGRATSDSAAQQPRAEAIAPGGDSRGKNSLQERLLV